MDCRETGNTAPVAWVLDGSTSRCADIAITPGAGSAGRIKHTVPEIWLVDLICADVRNISPITGLAIPLTG